MLQQVIEQKLQVAFKPQHLEVLNESYMHNVPAGSESHFKVILVSNDFEGKRLIARHREVNQILKDELAGPVHALSMHTYTEQEWLNESQQAPASPMCMGGSKKQQ